MLVAPVVAGLTDHEIPAILEAAASAGAGFAGRVVLRLPHGVGALFVDWLERHFPERRAKVMHRVQSMRGGRLYNARFKIRQRGTGIPRTSGGRGRATTSLGCSIRAGLLPTGPMRGIRPAALFSIPYRPYPIARRSHRNSTVGRHRIPRRDVRVAP